MSATDSLYLDSLSPGRREIIRWQAIRSPAAIQSGRYPFLITTEPMAVQWKPPGQSERRHIAARPSEILLVRYFCPKCPRLIVWALFEDETRERARPICLHCDQPEPSWWLDVFRLIGEIADFAVMSLRERFEKYQWGQAERERGEVQLVWQMACKVGGNARQRRRAKRAAEGPYQVGIAQIEASRDPSAVDAMFNSGCREKWNPWRLAHAGWTP